MVQIFYVSLFAFSLICDAVYIFIWHKHFDVSFAVIFAIAPVATLGYMLYGFAQSLEGSVRGMQISYIGGCFLQFFILLTILNFCQITVKSWILTPLFVLCVCMYISVLTIGHSDLFYKNIHLDIVGGNPVLYREYGIMHSVFYLVVLGFLAADIFVIVYSLIKKKQIPRTVIYLLLIPEMVSILSFFVGRRVLKEVDCVPLGYVLAQFFYILIAYRVSLYNVSDTVIDSYVQEQKLGYASFDFRYRYLGSNDIARQLLPILADLAVDERLGEDESFLQIRSYLDRFREDPLNNSFEFTIESAGENRPDGEVRKNGKDKSDSEKIYNVNVNYLYDGNHRRGYIVTFTDDTANRKYIRLLDRYNENLKQEVDEKTRHITDMHDNLIMSMAAMVESRDNSTGGHINRTSEGVRILVDEILKEGRLNLSPEFCEDVIKAAPMHDLGKIAVDDAVLRKPGKFTEEEFAKMKCHAAEGARVIHKILYNTDDESFKDVAENVAHYHHERWNGSGYPDGLSGEEIPVEARIMAIADVYDALVSKRVYKEAFDFEKADRIIMEGMGSQFDPGLEPVYVGARPELEKYYKSLQDSAAL